MKRKRRQVLSASQRHLLSVHSPHKTAADMAEEIGETTDYVRQALRRMGLAWKPDSTMPKRKGGRPASTTPCCDGPPIAGPSFADLIQKAEWPKDMRFVDAEGVR